MKTAITAIAANRWAPMLSSLPTASTAARGLIRCRRKFHFAPVSHESETSSLGPQAGERVALGGCRLDRRGRTGARCVRGTRWQMR